MDEAMTTATDATRVVADARAMYDSALRQWTPPTCETRPRRRGARPSAPPTRPANCRRSRPTPPGHCDNWQWTSQQYVACGAATSSAKACCTATASPQAFASRSRTLNAWSENNRLHTRRGATGGHLAPSGDTPRSAASRKPAPMTESAPSNLTRPGRGPGVQTHLPLSGNRRCHQHT